MTPFAIPTQYGKYQELSHTIKMSFQKFAKHACKSNVKVLNFQGKIQDFTRLTFADIYLRPLSCNGIAGRPDK